MALEVVVMIALLCRQAKRVEPRESMLPIRVIVVRVAARSFVPGIVTAMA